MAISFNMEKIAQKYRTRAKSAGQDWVDGIVNTNVDIVGRALANADNWHAAVSAQRALDKYKAGLSNTSTQEIKAKVQKLGASRYTTGIDAGADKYMKNMKPVLDYISADSDNIMNRAVVTPEDAAQKAADWVLYMSKYRKGR